MTRLLPSLALYLLALLAYALAPAWDWRWDAVVIGVGAFGGLVLLCKLAHAPEAQ